MFAKSLTSYFLSQTGVLQTTANDMNKQKETTDIAFERRIWETRDSKDKLQDHLLKVRGRET